MPIWLRRYYMHQLIEMKDREAEARKGTVNNTKNMGPM